jgi:hypothetical protein
MRSEVQITRTSSGAILFLPTKLVIMLCMKPAAPTFPVFTVNAVAM